MSVNADDLADFDADSLQKSPDQETGGVAISIVGREADPFQKEDWGDDFEDKPLGVTSSPAAATRPLSAALKPPAPHSDTLIVPPATHTSGAVTGNGSGRAHSATVDAGHTHHHHPIHTPLHTSASGTGTVLTGAAGSGNGAAGSGASPTAGAGDRVRSLSADNKKQPVSAIDSLFKPESSRVRGSELRLSKKSWDTELKFDDDAEEDLQSFAGTADPAAEAKLIALASISALSRRGGADDKSPDTKSNTIGSSSGGGGGTGSGDAALMANAKLGGVLASIDLSTVPLTVPEGSRMGKLTLKQLQEEMDQKAKAKAQARRNSRPINACTHSPDRH